MKRQIILLVLVVAWFSNHALTLEECVSGAQRPADIGQMVAGHQDGVFYRMSAGGDTIECVNLLSGKSEVVFDAKRHFTPSEITSWDGFAMSENEAVLLLWTNRRPIYRYSFSADYFTYNRVSGRLSPVSLQGNEEIATLSPDGQRIAYVKDNNLFVRSINSDITLQVTNDGQKGKLSYGVPDWVTQEELDMLSSLRWSPDGNTLALLSWDEERVPMHSMLLYEGECSMEPSKMLYPKSYDYKYPAAGERNSTVRVHTFDVNTGKLSTIDLSQYSLNEYITSIDFAPDGALILGMMTRQQNDFILVRHDLKRANTLLLYHERSDVWIEPSLMAQVKCYDNYYVIPSEQSGYAQLYRGNYKGDKVEALTHAKENVTQYYGCDKRGTHYYQRTDDPLRRVLCCVDKGGHERLLTGVTGWHSATFDGTMSCYVEQWSDARTPTQYKLFKSNGRHVRDLELNADYASRYCAPDVPKRDFFEFTTDGVTLNGFMLCPTDFDASKRYPVIMVQYSGPGSQQVTDRWGIDWIHYAAAQGYVVACVDGRGTGGRDRAFKTMVYRNLGHYETLDQLAAARHLAQQSWVVPDRIGIWGWSYGGYETLMAMSHPDSHYAAGVAIAPVTSWRYYDSTYTERFMDYPQSNAEGYDNSAPINHVDGLKGRLLLMFGSADDNVRTINSLQYIAQLHLRDVMFDMMVYTGMNHSINGCGVRLPLYRRVMEHFDTHLKHP